MPLPARYTYCLEHHCDEDQPSPRGLVCPECSIHLQHSPPHGECRSYWESQPVAYTIGGEPCWVYTLTWPNFRIRSLHCGGNQGLSGIKANDLERPDTPSKATCRKN